MSLGVATTSALAGLRNTSLGTRIVAENLANADIAGYGLRKIVATGTITGGRSAATQTTTVIRDVDPALLNDARKADAARQGAQTRLSGLTALENGFGIPGEAGAFNTLFTAFEASLRQAATTPESEAALQSVAQNASRIVAKFNSFGDQIQTIRQQADTAIAQDVDDLNILLGRVANLNKDIQRQTLLGGVPFDLMDERERAVNKIAELLPVSEIPRENNRILLVSAKGEILVDLDHAEFSFTKTPSIDAADTPMPGVMSAVSLTGLGYNFTEIPGISSPETQTSGRLSAIELNGRELNAQDLTLQTGRLGANLELRDTVAKNAQADLDLLALDLMIRFSGPSSPTEPLPRQLGLFTREGFPVLPDDPADPAYPNGRIYSNGAASEMRLSSLIDPSTGDGLWRLRSGLSSAAPGPASDPENITSMIAALSEDRALGTGLPNLNMAENLSEQVSKLTTARLDTEGELAFASANYSARQETLARRGVDTDAQMQSLLELERAYAANARVLSVVDNMMRSLLEI